MTRLDDDALRDRFKSLQQFDADHAPPFATPARRPRADARRPFLVGAAVAGAMVAVVLLPLASRSPPPEPAPPATLSWPVATASLTEVFSDPSAALDQALPSDALRRLPIADLKETP